MLMGLPLPVSSGKAFPFCSTLWFGEMSYQLGFGPSLFCVSWSNKSSEFCLQRLHHSTPAHRVTLHPCSAHTLDHSRPQTSDFAPNGSNSQVLQVDGWTRSERGSKVHGDLITERGFCHCISDRGAWNTLWSSGREQRTILEHCCCLGVTDGRQMDFKNLLPALDPVIQIPCVAADAAIPVPAL